MTYATLDIVIVQFRVDGNVSAHLASLWFFVRNPLAFQ
jgi:hypothetical protein